MSKFSPYTDLALETAETLTLENPKLDGVELRTEDCSLKDTTVTWVKITNKAGVKATGKPIGNYITLESPSMKENDIDSHEKIIELLSKYLSKIHNLSNNSTILIVGLGNWQVTPDALGPKVISQVLVTRHIRGTVPEDINNSVRSVAAITPGVMGVTGIETGEIIKGIVEKINPDVVIAIDALAARKANRVNATIQMSDTGVNPGAGVGNKRMALNQETLGVPVIAIGVPTVVDAATLVNDTLDKIIQEMLEATPNSSDFYNMLSSLEDDEKYHLIKQILDPYVDNMFVTPKEVDAVIDRLSNIISNALNIALHPGIGKEDINRFK